MEFRNVRLSPKVMSGQIMEVDWVGGGGGCRIHWSGENAYGVLVWK
jgi:hypothetical protein